MRTGIVLCSRYDSKRIPGKAFAPINGKPMIEHLVARLEGTGYPVYVAVPHRDVARYLPLAAKFPGSVMVVAGPMDPLARMAKVAELHDLEAVVRVCHDKVFVDPAAVLVAVELVAGPTGADYVVPTDPVDGTAFEVIATPTLLEAARRFRDIEHISYAVDVVARQKVRTAAPEPRQRHRLLVDHPEDLRVLELVLNACGNDCTLSQALDFLDANTWVSHINAPPLVTIYTCALNAEQWIEKAMGSIAEQRGFARHEYILVDDHSKDRTPLLMAKFCERYPNARWIRNAKNLGLASASNVALDAARGRYLLRLDADDWLLDRTVVDSLVQSIEASGADALYPACEHRPGGELEKGHARHHVGGALFRARAAQHVRFTSGLRGYEGLDFWLRARETLKIAYYDQPTFAYRQREGSLSRTDVAAREMLRQELEARSRNGSAEAP